MVEAAYRYGVAVNLAHFWRDLTGSNNVHMISSAPSRTYIEGVMPLQGSSQIPADFLTLSDEG